MDVLRIRLFGTLRVVWDGDGSELPITRTAQALLAYLILHRHRLHSRQTLAGLFWGDHSEDRARGCLNTVLWRLRRGFGAEWLPRDGYLLATAAGEVGFRESEACWLDVAEFEARTAPVRARPFHALESGEADRIEAALPLYEGDLLEGFNDEWALRERERLRGLFLDSLTCLMRFRGFHGEYQESAELGQRVLAQDPLREEIHRYLMRLYAESGQRAAAVRQYHTCRDHLRRELGIEPMEETQELFAGLTQTRGRSPLRRPAGRRPVPLDAALSQLHTAVHGFERAQETLRQAIELVERCSSDPHR